MKQNKKKIKKPEIEINGFPCIECGSTKTIAHTDSELRRLHLLVWQCFGCNSFFETGWDIDD